ncbi:rhomboid family intramembrane serine protease [Nakamurella antarctica]|uniref:rhomboid family intramembrane serine protease n=1 Tax=Nakamurella antarctica TaxID=1902245 RepID=UPI0013DDDBAD|nr:rhomboid family intramembrane serine protease [Nakamurella antarctica]
MAGSILGQQPLITYVLIAVNVLVFVITMIQAGGESRLPTSEWLSGGWLVPGLAANGDYWQYITSGFLHLSLIHVALNMLSLYFLGIALERMVGRGRFLAIYVLALLGGSVAVMYLSAEYSATAGASGAIFGLMGALVVTFRRLKFNLRPLAGILVLNIGITVFNNTTISWQGHLGGLLVGAAVGAVMVYLPAKDRTRNQVLACAGIFAVIVLLILIRAAQLS